MSRAAAWLLAQTAGRVTRGAALALVRQRTLGLQVRLEAAAEGGGVTMLTIPIACPLPRPRSVRTCLHLLLALMSHTWRRMTSRLQVQLALLSLLCRCLLLLLMSMAAPCLPAQTERLVTGSAALPPVGL